MSKYDVPPFSGKNYARNSAKAGNDACAICGRFVKDANHFAVVTDGGASWGDEGSDSGDPGYMGSWPVGNDCHRKHSTTAGAQHAGK